MKSAGKLILALALLVLMGLLTVMRAEARVEWVDLPLDGGNSVRAAFGAVEGSRGPAIIFNHGTGVRLIKQDDPKSSA